MRSTLATSLGSTQYFQDQWEYWQLDPSMGKSASSDDIFSPKE